MNYNFCITDNQTTNFKIFETMKDESTFFGFDKILKGGPVSVYFSTKSSTDLLENHHMISYYYYSKENQWKKLPNVDETDNLTHSGYVKFYFPDDFIRSKLFGINQYWVKQKLDKIQLSNLNEKINDVIKKIDRSETKIQNLHFQVNESKENKKQLDEKLQEKIQFYKDKREEFLLQKQELELIPNVREIEKIYLNAVSSTNSNKQEFNRSSDGTKNQEFLLEDIPIKEEPIKIWINEINFIKEKEISELKKTGAIKEKKTLEGKAIEQWVLWSEIQNIKNSKPHERHFSVNKVSRKIKFGDGIHGMIPPSGSNNIKIQYFSGGGKKGNISENQIRSLITSVPFVEEVTNPLPSENGLDEESLSQILERGPYYLRHQGKPVSKEDFEWVVKENFSSVAKVKCLPATNPTGRTEGGWVSIIIVPHSKDHKPIPSVTLLQSITKHLSTVSGHSLNFNHLLVRAPIFVKVKVTSMIFFNFI